MAVSSRSTVFILGAGVIVLLALITWAARSSWISSLHLQALHSTLEAQTDDLPDDAQILLTRLNSLLLANVLDLPEGEEAASRFEETAEALRERLGVGSMSSGEGAHAALAERIAIGFERYYEAANGLMREVGEGQSTAARYQRLQAVQKQADAMLLELSSASQVSERELEATFRSYHSAYNRLALLLILLPAICIVLAGSTLFVALQNRLAALRLDLSRAKLAQAKQEKLASLGTMASGVAHEIRNPLTALKARLYALERRIESNPEARAQAAEIGKEINRLDRIVKEFLMFGRPAEPAFEEVEVQELLEQVVDLLRKEVEERDLRLLVGASESVRVRCDPEQVKQVLINLVQNAADASEAGDAITLSAASLPGDGRGSAKRVALQVADEGSGVPEEHAPHLFNPFFTGKAAGVGLGLSIAKRIAQIHKGDIVFESKPQEGSTFTLILPSASS